MGGAVQESNPSEGEIFCSHPDQPWGPPNLMCSGYWVPFHRGKAFETWR